MKQENVIIFDRQPREDYQAISLEQVIKRRLQRRRRVAKRMLKRFPLFAVEEMQIEFPGYTYEEFEADILRKSRKDKRYRTPKTKAFDWKYIKEEIPEFFNKCIERKKTKAVLRGRLKSGHEFTCIVRSYWFGEYGECRLRTSELINLWRGPLKNFMSHPAILILENNNEL